MKIKNWKIVFFTFFLAINSLTGYGADGKERMDRSRLNIGAYFLQPYACSEQHVKDAKACGIDFIVCMRNERPVLDLFSKYGLGAIVSGVVPGWWGGDGDNAGTLNKQNPLTKYDEAAKNFKDHPAIWGIDIGDEPSALDFPHYGKIMDRVKKLFPNQFPYLNLYPNYASVAKNTDSQTINQLGTTTYEQHIAAYCKNVAANYLCYDFYMYSTDVNRAYDNLRVVADACQATNRSMWIVLQVNSDKEKLWISENQLRFQAYTAMAFGAENIIWACYTAGWWHNQVVDSTGKKTQQYEKLKKVNGEILTLGENYMKYRRNSTSFVGFEGQENSKWLKGVRQVSESQFDGGVFKGVALTDGCPMVVGHMLSRSGNNHSALFICPADDPYDKKPQSHELRFKVQGRKIAVTGVNGKVTPAKLEDGWYTIPVKSSSALLIEATEE